ncbi:MAG: hypothetical protein LBP95_05165 [Deltaproteobacteria bacterium]|jgi:hypothetical protein|nr:hypothetical protein [Deltaproteobacteria bacterium]
MEAKPDSLREAGKIMRDGAGAEFVERLVGILPDDPEEQEEETGRTRRTVADKK